MSSPAEEIVEDEAATIVWEDGGLIGFRSGVTIGAAHTVGVCIGTEDGGCFTESPKDDRSESSYPIEEDSLGKEDSPDGRREVLVKHQ